MQENEILNRLNELTKSYSFRYVLTEIVFRDFTGPIDQLFSKNNMDHLNHREFSFLLGLWLKNVDFTEPELTNDDLKKTTSEVYSLLTKLHYTFIDHFKFDYNEMEKKDPDGKLSKGLNLISDDLSGKVFQELMFYSGTGAYDKQYSTFVLSKYKYDKKWLFNNKKFYLESLPKFYENIKHKLQKKLNDRKILKDLSDKDVKLNLLCLSREEIINDDKDFENILNSLSTSISDADNLDYNNIGDFNIYQEKPIIKLEDNLYFIPSAFAIAESIYESPYYWMQQDTKYRNISLHNRGIAAEEITANILKRVFGGENIYQNVLINKNKNTQVTDVDILAVYNDKALIFQVKAKKLTALSKNGNADSIRKDFKNAIQDSYDQGKVCRECLTDYKNYKYPNNDVSFSNRLKDIKSYYIVNIVLDDYPGITNQVHIFLSNSTDELPVAINIFDLELIAKYIPKPQNFIEYIANRSKYSKYFKADNEMTYLGFHLKRGLKNYGSDYVVLDYTWANSIDKKYYNEVYDTQIKQAAQKKIQRNDPCFCLSGLKYKKCHGKMY